MKLTSVTKVDGQEIISNLTQIHSLNIESANDLTEKELITELMIQSNNLGQINQDNLSGYLTPRDIQKLLQETKSKLDNLVSLLVEKRRNEEV